MVKRIKLGLITNVGNMAVHVQEHKPRKPRKYSQKARVYAFFVKHCLQVTFFVNNCLQRC